MLEPVGDILTRALVHAAVYCYLARFAVEISWANIALSRHVARWIWTAGAILLLVHVACAFHFFHHWSHQHAYAHTATTTQNVVGVHWGGGLYFNYVFALVWLADVLDWWRRGAADRPRAQWWTWTVHTFAAFMVFNATVVFGRAYWRWIGAAAVLIFGVLLLMRRYGRPVADK